MRQVDSMKNDEVIMEKVNEIVRGHCNDAGNIVHGHNKGIEIIALAVDKKEADWIDCLFFERGYNGEKHYGVARKVILFAGKVCWECGSANWLTQMDGYRHFQYRIAHDEDARILWHSPEWNELLEYASEHVIVSVDSVTHGLWVEHEEAIHKDGVIEPGSQADCDSYDYLLAYAIPKVFRNTVDGGLTLDNAWYTYQIDDLEDDLKAALKRVKEN